MCLLAARIWASLLGRLTWFVTVFCYRLHSSSACSRAAVECDILLPLPPPPSLLNPAPFSRVPLHPAIPLALQSSTADVCTLDRSGPPDIKLQVPEMQSLNGLAVSRKGVLR